MGSHGTGRFVIRYRHPGSFQGADGSEHPIGWVYAVDLVDYFGIVYDNDPGWSHTVLADEATLYRNRDHVDEVIERMADHWPAATIVDIDAAPVVDVDTARSLDDGMQAGLVVLAPGTRFIEPLATERAQNPVAEGPALPSPDIDHIDAVPSPNDEEARNRLRRRPAGMEALMVAYDTMRDLSAYELAVDLLREASPDRAAEFEAALADARGLLDTDGTAALTVLSAEAARGLDQIGRAAWDETSQAALGLNVHTIVAKLRGEANPEVLAPTVGGAVLGAVDRMAEAAGPDRWPNVRADHYRQPAAALEDAQRALAKVNDILDRASQPDPGVGVGAPPLEPAPDTGPDIGL